MQNFISLVNDQFYWEEVSPHRHDCHDPPHTIRVGLYDDSSPPRRLAVVAGPTPWKATSAQAGFPEEAIRRGRLHWVVESNLRCNNRGKEYLRRDRRGEDRHPVLEICVLARLGAAKIAVGHEVRSRSEQDWRRLLLHEEFASRCLQLERCLVVQAIWYIVANDHTATETPLMETPTKTLDQLSKVVVGFLNGSRVKGYVCDFSALKQSFDLLPQEDPLQGGEVKVELKDLKAVFFVWEFTGNPEYYDSLRAAAPKGGFTLEVTFTDGEKIVGRSEGYSSQPIGFFMFPTDPKGNNIRIFVVTRNTRQVRLI
jgi:hypothetical protein